MTALAILCAKSYDVLGMAELRLRASTRFGQSSRRVNRVKTLDGGYALNDSGHADSDRTITLEWDADADVDTVVEYMIRYHSRMTLSIKAGCWLVAAQSFETRRGTSTLVLLALDRLAA